YYTHFHFSRTSSLSLSFFFYCSADHRDLHSFPTRRSSDLEAGASGVHRVRGLRDHDRALPLLAAHHREREREYRLLGAVDGKQLDRKSTRLNSSHDQISYAVFCLKKKKKKQKKITTLINNT